MSMRFCWTGLLIAAVGLFATAQPAHAAVPVLAVDFGEADENHLQSGFLEMTGDTSQTAANASFGSYTVDLTGQGFADSNNGGSVSSGIRPLYRDYYYNNADVTGEGVTLAIGGVTPNVPYSLTIWSYDADQSFSSTPTLWSPYQNTTGASGSITNFATPRPATLNDYSTTIQVSSTTTTLDIFGTTTSGFGGTRLNAFRLNDGTSDVFAVDFGRPSNPTSGVQPGFTGMSGLQAQDSATQTIGAFHVTVQGQGFEETATGNANEIDPSIRDLYRDQFYHNSDVNGVGVTLTIQGVTPGKDYDVKVWSYDAAQSFSSTPTVWSPTGDTSGTSASVTNFAFPRPTSLDDYSTTIRVHSTTDTLTIFGTTTSGFGGTRLNAFQLYEVSPALPGDFDGDHDVDGADFVVWQTNYPATSGHLLGTGDADGDGDVDGADFVAWQTNFGSSPDVASVPEPTAIVLCCLGIPAFIRAKYFRRSRRCNGLHQ